jgi:hypothetical protein
VGKKKKRRYGVCFGGGGCSSLPCELVTEGHGKRERKKKVFPVEGVY